MPQDRTSEPSDLLTEVTEPPDYQRFIALNIQVPQIRGQRFYHRVTISSSLKDLAADLSLVLPSKLRRILGSQPETPISFRHSRRTLPSPNPYRDPYIAVCSCRQKDCEHIDYAIKHFQLIQRFSENSGHISYLIQESRQRMMEAEQTRRELEIKLHSLEEEREELIKGVESEGRAGKQVVKLHGELEVKDSEIANLCIQLEQKYKEQEHLQLEMMSRERTYREKLEAVLSEFWRGRDEPSVDTPKGVPDEMLHIFTRHFMPPPSDVSPEEKLQENVSADHHRVSNTMGLLGQLANINFIRELGIGQRHNTKSGKVRIKPEVERLELLVPHKGQADIIRIITTAPSKSQQFFAAYLIGNRFGVEVQYPS